MEGPATSADLVAGSLAVDSTGRIFVCDGLGFNGLGFIGDSGARGRDINTIGIINAFAGNGTLGFSDDDHLAAKAYIANPSGISLDAAGNLYLGDWNSYKIRKVDSNGQINTVAGNGVPCFGGPCDGDGGPATSASIGPPAGIVLDDKGNLFFSEGDYGCCVRKVDTNGIIHVFAGGGNHGLGDGGPATEATLNWPAGLAFDSSGALYISDYYDYRVRKVDTHGIITTVVGNGTSGFSGDGGPAVNAEISGPTGLAFDDAGNLYIGDGTRVRKVDKDGIISTFAGNGTAGYSGDGGPATNAELTYVDGVAVDPFGSVFISDGNNLIRKVDTKGIITTFAGDGTVGFAGDGGPATSARFSHPGGLAVDANGDLFVGDVFNYRVRKITLGTPPTCSPVIQGGATSLEISVTANCNDSNGTITSTFIDWGDGSQPTSGSTGSHTYSNAGTYVVTVTAINNFQQQGSAVQAVTLTPPAEIPPAVFAGQDTGTTLSVTAPPNAAPTVTFKCMQATLTTGNGQQTQDPSAYGISCTFSPPTATLSNTPVFVTLAIQTTGASGRLSDPFGTAPLSASLAMFFPFPAIVLFGPALLGGREARRDMIRVAWLGLATMLLLLSMGCGGGFTVPAQNVPPPSQTQTPAGKYTLTVAGVDSNGFVQISLIVPLQVTGPQ
jgi:hypothetical protein